MAWQNSGAGVACHDVVPFVLAAGRHGGVRDLVFVAEFEEVTLAAAKCPFGCGLVRSTANPHNKACEICETSPRFG
jgi:hypothetical protein